MEPHAAPAGPTRSRIRYHLPVILTLVVGAAASLVLFFAVRQVEHRRLQTEFDARAEGIRIAQQNPVNTNAGDLQSPGSIYAASEAADAAEFATFTAASLDPHAG